MNMKYILKLFCITCIFHTNMMEINSITVEHIHGKHEIEEAGCKYHSDIQLLMRNVCLMPEYQLNEPPRNSDGKTNIDVHLKMVPQVLEINEKKNKITVQITQYMEWEDSRISANLSAISNMVDLHNYVKLPPSAVHKIWNPNLDMYTYKLQDWKSLYHPYWFISVGINKCPWLRSCDLTPNITSLYAEKSWRVTLFCKFDFSRFPFDTQHCRFRQVFQSTSDVAKLFLFSPYAERYVNNETKNVKMDWNYEGDGFRIIIDPIGTLTDPSTITQNSTGDFGFDIILERIAQPYMFQYYFPCAAIVIISQISFIIPLSAIPGRVGLVVTQFLTLTNIFIYQMVR